MAYTFHTIIQHIREDAYTEKDKGGRFEKIIKNYFRTSRNYASQVKDIWLWGEFPYRSQFGGKDTGIDLVIRTVIGDYWAVQCKCYAEGAVLDKKAVDTFLSTSGRTFVNDLGKRIGFAERFFVSTAALGQNALDAMEHQQIPCHTLYSWEIGADLTVDWKKLEDDTYGQSAAVKAERHLLPHQKEALLRAKEHYAAHDRGRLIMACGTGKTFTALRLAEQETEERGLILVLVPSIALVNQTLNEWNTFAKKPLAAICVCSDATASKKKNDDSDEDTIDLAQPATTNPVSIARQIALREENHSGMVVVFSTYQSIDAIAEAQRILCGEKKVDIESLFPIDKENHIDPKKTYDFDFIICDEAHRTTGQSGGREDESHFIKVHDNDFLRAKKRLYMTATPRLYAPAAKKKAEENSVILCSMDDTTLYGEEFYRIGFGEAVERGLLADYKVLILTVKDSVKDQLPESILSAIADKDEEINTSDAVKLVGVINALSKRVDEGSESVKEIDPGLMHKAVAFCSKITASKAITDSFNKYAKSLTETFDDHIDEPTVQVSARHIDGTMKADERNTLLTWLREAPTDGEECRILTNVRCLSEGVDVPSLDAVIFLSSRDSQVDVVQSVGRVMRTAPGKKYGYIIIPIVIPADGDPNAILDKNDDFKVVWSVLNALRAHDDRFNAWVNKLELNEKKPEKVIIGPGTDLTGHPGDGVGEAPKEYVQGLLFDSEVKQALYAKMVLKVGQRHYWEQWAGDVAEIAARHQERIRRLIETDENYKAFFDLYVDGLHRNINPGIGETEAIEMLSQHMVTKPVFDALFGDSSFTESNPISQSMKKLLDLVDETAYEKDQATMQRFYDSVRQRCEGIDNAPAKQKIIIELYDKFFKKALSKTVDKLGIVYTPVEIVDFINQSVADILRKEFHRSLSDENVHIIDPFTGTGTFIVRMIQSGLIRKEALARKYREELHANEIVLLAYYIASVNIENAYHDAMGEEAGRYTPFSGICLTDTFQLYEDENGDVQQLKFSDAFPSNSDRLITQAKTPMQIVIGNPPYSVGQTRANDNAQNEHYENLEKRIADTYAAETKATNKNALYDSYIKAFRWASDRLGETGGIIGFVINSGWLDKNVFTGLRKCFEREFSTIYVYNLKGAIRAKAREEARREGQSVFNIMTGTCIVILVKKAGGKEKADIYYREIGDFLNRKEKLEEIKSVRSVAASVFTQRVLKPNAAGDWLNQRSDLFTQFTAIGDKKDKGNACKWFTDVYSRGVATARDSWCYNASRAKLADNICKTIKAYEEERTIYKKLSEQEKKTFEPTPDSTKISWASSTKQQLYREKEIQFHGEHIVNALYRPFTGMHMYFDTSLNERTYQMPRLFPTLDSENRLICICGVGSRKPFSVLLTDKISDLELVEKAQCFPLYWYEEDKREGEINMFAEKKDDGPCYVRKDGITDYIWNLAKEQYHTSAISKEDLFYYVYGLLHSEDYRKEFAADLKKMLPRIPLVEKESDFKAFMKAGRALADLHLHYEDEEPPEGVIVEKEADDYHVTKMRFGGKKDKSVILYNDAITIRNIPLTAYDYIVNGRSAIEWVMESYRVKTDKASGIVNDPNDWAKEHDDPAYILRLLLSVITVSEKTLAITSALPRIHFKKEE